MTECCVPCPNAAQYRAPAGIRSGLRDPKPEPSCPCHSCRCSKPSVVKPTYRQPRIPESFAPRRTYTKPSSPIETSTTYKLSYLPNAGAKNLRNEVRRPAQNIVPSCEPMDCSTVQKLSYLPNQACAAQPIRPSHHEMWGQGPMQHVTTQRHDYVPKPSVLRESCKPPPQFHCVEQPFENRTISRLSFCNPGPSQVPVSYAPQSSYEKPEAKMDLTTTQKMSYQPLSAPRPQLPPWACKEQYQKPCQKLDANTIYKASFLPPGDEPEYVNPPCKYAANDCKPCNCIRPAQCMTTNPCACNFPKAACCT